MSLICINCNKTIVLSDTPDHLAGCASCNINEEQGKLILKSSADFNKKMREWRQQQ